MKKIVMLIALFVGFAGFSQEKDAYREDALQLVKYQTEGQFDVMLKPIKNRIPAENQEAFMKEIKASFPDLYQQLTDVYMEAYTHEEIKKILEFYESPVGQKVIEKTPIITQKSMEIGRSWGQKLRPIMAKYMK